MCLRNFRHFKKVNLKSAASLNYVCFFFPNLVFLCIGLSQCWLRNFTQKITKVFWVAPNWSQRILKENIFWGRNALSNTIYTTLDADATWTCFRIVFKSSLCSVPIVSGSNFSADILLGTVGLLPKGSDYCILNGHNVTIWPELFLLNVVPNWYLETLLLQVDVISAFCIVIHLLNDSTVWCAKTACTYRYVNLQPSQDRS